jgi:hypothetical protein
MGVKSGAVPAYISQTTIKFATMLPNLRPRDSTTMLESNEALFRVEYGTE